MSDMLHQLVVETGNSQAMILPALPERSSGKAVSRIGIELAPKEFANFSPGLSTLGNKAVKILIYSERVKEPHATLSELGVQCWLIDPGKETPG